MNDNPYGWYEQWWREGGTSPIPHYYRIVTTWWETDNNNRIRLLDPNEPRATWEVTIGGRDLYSIVTKSDRYGRREARIENINVTVTPNFNRYAVDSGHYEAFRTEPDELDIRWDWVDIREAAGILGQAVVEGVSAGIIANAAMTTLAQTAANSTSGVLWNDPNDNPREDLGRAIEDPIYFAERYCRVQEKDSAADERAKDLLMSLLSPAQQEQFRRSGSFKVTTPAGNVYELKSHRNYNITRTLHDGGKVTMCAVLNINRHYGDIHPLPIYDQLAAQLLMLETDEQKFLSLANKMNGRFGHAFASVEWR